MVTGADRMYTLSTDPQTIVVPDVAFIRWERLPGRTRPKGYIPFPPDLAVQVRSPTDEPGVIARRQDLYRAAGVPLVWWVDPEQRTVQVFQHGALAGEYGEGDVLDGADVLPGFTLPVADIFADA